MKTLILGGTGTVGSRIVERLSDAKYDLRVLTTSEAKAKKLRGSVHAYIGSLENAASMQGAFEGVDNVFMLNAQSQTEVQQGLQAISAAKKAGVKKFVYQSIHNVREAAHVNHFKPKIQIEDALKESGLRYVFICPNNFYQNDIWLKQSITQYKLYNQPIGSKGINRVDVRDIAEVVQRVFETDKYDFKSITVAGPDSLTGEDTARILTEKLGYRVEYAGDDLQLFRDSFSQWLPAWIVEDWAVMYQYFQEKGLKATESELLELSSILLRQPRSYEEFLSDHLSVFQS